MKNNLVIFLFLLCILGVIITGCTSLGSSSAPSTVTPTPQIVYVTVLVTQTPTPTPTQTPVINSTTTTPKTTQSITSTITTTATPTSDPILHRWIRKIEGTTPIKAYELKFYPGGTVVYNYGTFKEVSSNMMIVLPADIQATGTWTNVGENKYLVKVLPTNYGGAPYVWEYTYVPVYLPDGTIFSEHIENTEERAAVPKGRQQMPGEMFYPERAKID